MAEACVKVQVLSGWLCGGMPSKKLATGAEKPSSKGVSLRRNVVVARNHQPVTNLCNRPAFLVAHRQQ
jgi:hypothetical protein